MLLLLDFRKIVSTAPATHTALAPTRSLSRGPSGVTRALPALTANNLPVSASFGNRSAELPLTSKAVRNLPATVAIPLLGAQANGIALCANEKKKCRRPGPDTKRLGQTLRMKIVGEWRLEMGPKGDRGWRRRGRWEGGLGGCFALGRTMGH